MIDEPPSLAGAVQKTVDEAVPPEVPVTPLGASGLVIAIII